MVPPRNKYERHSTVPSLLSPNPCKPLKDLPFRFEDLKAAVPRELFEACVSTSWFYIAKDVLQFAVAAAATWLALQYIPEFLWPVRWLVWATYWFVQGTTGFGLWVIAHECGHKAYFGPKRRWLNSIVGFTIHTAMLVPYHSWRISHATHHKFTNHRYFDTAFPQRRKPSVVYPILEYMPALALPHMLSYLVFGWVAYLALNLEGNWYSQRNGWISHFEPWSPLFAVRERPLIVLTDIGLGVVMWGCYLWAQAFGWQHFVCWYLVPWAVTHSWLVVVTFLQHTDRDCPHYEDNEWEFVKGALATVDRDYGIFNVWLHHITNGHVVHHLFSTMPFYNAIKATPIIAEKVGAYYLSDTRPLYQQVWDSWFAHQVSFQTNPVWLARTQSAASRTRK